MIFIQAKCSDLRSALSHFEVLACFEAMDISRCAITTCLCHWRYRRHSGEVKKWWSWLSYRSITVMTAFFFSSIFLLFYFCISCERASFSCTVLNYVLYFNFQAFLRCILISLEENQWSSVASHPFFLQFFREAYFRCPTLEVRVLFFSISFLFFYF